MNNDQDLQNDTSVNVPELLLGLGLIGLGTYLAFRSASKSHMGVLTVAHHVPSDITFQRGPLPNEYTGTVTMCGNVSSLAKLDLTYNPPGNIAPGAATYCNVNAGASASDPFKFTKTGNSLHVIATVYYPDGYVSSLTVPT